jgi:glyoxylase-like metal-dependent hydrolase (beta-lactamase superfamily II)/ferredoxin
MANPKKRLPSNVAGEFFVDATCINCDACRQLAPATFKEIGDYSAVHAQPRTAEQERQAVRALLACPTGSIGTVHHNNAREVKADFPLPIADEVYYCGYNSPKSYGGNSYFLRHREGNWLIDSPKYLPYLVGRLEELGGVRYVFLTHSDDVADAAHYARHFGSRRLIHRAELAAQPDAELVLAGTDPIRFASEFLIIPTPGHTAGHCVLLYHDRFLFTGDHLWWDREEQCLGASRDYCWDSWADQTRSMARLLEFRFEWVLPGHGQRVELPIDRMRYELTALVERMRRGQ